jgi:SAM-dependent methyltransferase
VLGDASSLSRLCAGEEQFDFVVCNCGFWYFDDPAHVLSDVYALLRPHGQLAFNLPALSLRGAEKGMRRKLREMLSRLEIGGSPWGTARRQANYIDLLAQSGFRVVRDEQCELEMVDGLREEWRRIPVFSRTGPARLLQNAVDAMKRAGRAWPARGAGRRSTRSAWRMIVAERAKRPSVSR